MSLSNFAPASTTLGAQSVARLADLTDYLTDRGYSAGTVRSYVRATKHFEHWLASDSHPLAVLGKKIVDEFLTTHLPTCSCPPPVVTDKKAVRAGLNHFIRMLQQRGVAVVDLNVSGTPVDEEVEAFDTYLAEVCGSATNTRIYRHRYVRQFLVSIFGSGSVDASAIAPQDVMSHVAGLARAFKPGTVKVITSSLRSYFRFLALHGAPVQHLTGAVPSIPGWRMASLPKALTHGQLDALLSAFDVSEPTGSRDYVFALLMAHLGLRTQEVTCLTLDSVDWRKGCIRVPGSKTKRQRELPLPRQLGEALARYLREGRPISKERFLFLRHTVPRGRPVTSGIVRGSIRRACARADILPPQAGPHALRHTAATRLVQHGVSLPDIADILGHTCIDTTAIYAKVDIPRLTCVALPWPGRTS